MSDNVTDDEVMMRYLLGKLPEKTQIELEERFFSDDRCMKNAATSELLTEAIKSATAMVTRNGNLM